MNIMYVLFFTFQGLQCFSQRPVEEGVIRQCPGSSCGWTLNCSCLSIRIIHSKVIHTEGEKIEREGKGRARGECVTFIWI